MTENRVDPTVAGLFLVAFITLIFGFLGVSLYSANEIFGAIPAAGLATLVGIMFIVLTVSAIRCGNAFAAALFAFVAISLLAVSSSFGTSAFVFILLGIMYIVFALVALIIGAPKLLMILLFLVGLLYIFVGAFVYDGGDTFALLFGVFGILSGVVALYLGFALSTQKLPVF
ncbi:MAG: hypothetical protein LBV13_03545 [Methanomassiliicoccaceae archaeon]|jgi:hypothetical protein|nr:hypothetical protein [Methanomassiliicoccaceae archaeon]